MDNHATVTAHRRKKERGEKLVWITCYDFAAARLLDGIADALLVGDSLGDNVLGYTTTVPVTLDEMIHHAKAVRRGTESSLIIVDMPFLTYQVSAEDALRNAGRIVKETGVEAVKVEGGVEIAPTIKRMVSAGIAVAGHVGFTPQSVHALGGYRKVGKGDASAEKIRQDARAVADAGAFAIVLELIPDDLAVQITSELAIPTIGIGAGPGCDGQVQVFHDLIGLAPARKLRHVKRYAETGADIRRAASEFAEEVRDGRF